MPTKESPIDKQYSFELYEKHNYHYSKDWNRLIAISLVKEPCFCPWCQAARGYAKLEFFNMEHLNKCWCGRQLTAQGYCTVHTKFRLKVK